MKPFLSLWTLPKDGAPHFGLALSFQFAFSAGSSSLRYRYGTLSESYRVIYYLASSLATVFVAAAKHPH